MKTYCGLTEDGWSLIACTAFCLAVWTPIVRAVVG